MQRQSAVPSFATPAYAIWELKQRLQVIEEHLFKLRCTGFYGQVSCLG
jgi:hypothetical protein